jgi:hypothetical protein
LTIGKFTLYSFIYILYKLYQAIIPLAAMLGWVLCAYACIFGTVLGGTLFNYFTSLFATPTQSWTSVMNPLVTILTIKSYRKAVLHLFCSCRMPNGISPMAFGGFIGTDPTGGQAVIITGTDPVQSTIQTTAAGQKYAATDQSRGTERM